MLRTLRGRPRYTGRPTTSQDIVPIPGTKRRVYLESNAAAMEIVLSPDEVAQLDALFPFDAAAGERYNEQMAQWIDNATA